MLGVCRIFQYGISCIIKLKTMELVFTILIGVVIGAVNALPMFLKKWIRQTVGLLLCSMWW